MDSLLQLEEVHELLQGYLLSLQQVIDKAKVLSVADAEQLANQENLRLKNDLSLLLQHWRTSGQKAPRPSPVELPDIESRTEPARGRTMHQKLANMGGIMVLPPTSPEGAATLESTLNPAAKEIAKARMRAGEGFSPKGLRPVAKKEADGEDGGPASPPWLAELQARKVRATP